MSYTFQVAKGGRIGASLLDEDHIVYAREMIAKAEELGVKLLLPVDNVATPEFSPDAEAQVTPSMSIPVGLMGMDIGPKTVELFTQAIQGAATVFWNGPMGVFEFPSFAAGTNAVAKALAQQKDAITIVGGGDSVSAIEKTGYGQNISHVSTGGGAALEFLEGLELPAIACLADRAETL